ncbi:MAG: DUF2336 domain-containing protein [Hyphomonadaceae bacterium]
MAVENRFAKLVDLAREKDSARRRDLLRDVTDLFFETRGQRSEVSDGLFGDILQAVAADMQDGVLQELSLRFADAPDAPVGLMRDLANHSFEVAAPVLKRSKVLTDDDLVKVVHYQSQAHIKAVAQRERISENVSAVIVKLGDDHALDALIRNDGAQISRVSMEAAVDRARKNTLLHEGVVSRRDMPLDLLNEMYFLVETRLREQILEKNASVDPQTLDAALAKTRERMRRSAGAVSEDMRKAVAYVRAQKALGQLNGKLLVSLFRDNEMARFLCGFAEITGIDYETARGIIERQDIDALAMTCRASDIERPLFVTLAMLVAGGTDGVMKGEQFGKMYLAVPVEAAQRAMRFYKMRKAADEKAAA